MNLHRAEVLMTMNVKAEVPIPRHYRPQTKSAKVMFSQVFVCPRWGGVSLTETPWTETPSRQRPSPRTQDGNERAVRILLECILILEIFLT